MPLSDDRVAGLLATMTDVERTASVQFLDVDGHIASAGNAVVEIARRLPVVGPPIARLGRFGPTNRLIEASYRLVARHRHRLARFVRDVEPVTRWRTRP